MTTTKKVKLSDCRIGGVTFEVLADPKPAEGQPPEPQVRREWSMVANTGATMARWWGSLVLDLEGAKYGQRLALLLDHDTQARIGYSTKVERTKRGLEAKGKLLSNEAASQVLSESREGFPWQASLMAVPTVIEEVNPNVRVSVNGQEMVGPLTVFRQWTLRELTLTVLGADGDTSAEAFAEDGEVEVQTMTTKKDAIEEPAKLSAGQAEPDPKPQPKAPAPLPNPEVLAAERETAERTRCSPILRHCAPEQVMLGHRLIRDNVPMADALSQILRDTRERLTVPATPATAPHGNGNGSGQSEAQRFAAMPEAPEKWKAEWEAQPKLRAEFLGEEKAWLAFKRNAHRFKMYGRSEESLLIATAAEKLTGGLVGLSPRNIIGTYFWALEETQAASWVNLIATKLTVTQPTELSKWLSSVPAMQKWTGERRMKALKDFELSIIPDKFENTLGFDVDDVRRDQTGQVALKIRELAQKAATLEQRLFTTLLEANANGYDGAAFFADTHLHGGTVDNNLSYTCTAPDTPTSAEMVGAILASIQAILGFTDDSGDPANEFAKQFVVMVPTKFWSATKAALMNDFTSAGVSNTLKTMNDISIVPVVNVRLNGTAVAAGRRFYVFRTDAPIKPCIWAEETIGDGFKTQDENSFDGFWKDRIAMGAKRIANGVLGRFEMCARMGLA